MAVIKGGQSGRVLRDAVVLDLGDLGRCAKEIVDEAKRQAAQIVADSQERQTQEEQAVREAAEKSGYEAGHAKGLAEGREAGRQAAMEEHAATLEQLGKAWQQSLANWEGLREKLLLESREDVLRFAFQMAEQITLRQVKTDPAMVVDQVTESLRLLNDPSSIEILIHPDDQDLVEEALPHIIKQLDATTHARLTADASIQRGGCRVRSVGGEIDAQIDSQLQVIADALFQQGQA